MQVNISCISFLFIFALTFSHYRSWRPDQMLSELSLVEDLAKSAQTLVYSLKYRAGKFASHFYVTVKTLLTTLGFQWVICGTFPVTVYRVYERARVCVCARMRALVCVLKKLKMTIGSLSKGWFTYTMFNIFQWLQRSSLLHQCIMEQLQRFRK